MPFVGGGLDGFRRGGKKMKLLLQKFFWVNVACFSVCSALSFGQSPEARESLAACHSGLEACEASRTVPPRLPPAATPGGAQKTAGAAELSDRLVVCTDDWKKC